MLYRTRRKLRFYSAQRIATKLQTGKWKTTDAKNQTRRTEIPNRKPTIIIIVIIILLRWRTTATSEGRLLNGDLVGLKGTGSGADSYRVGAV